MIDSELRSRPLVFVENLEHPVLAEADHYHLSRSLRCRPGDPIAVGDGAGRWLAAVLGPELAPVEVGTILEADAVDRGPNLLTVGFAVVKGDRSELAVQKLTELGVHRIIPMTTERTVVRWDEVKVARNHERHRRVAREAAMQSRNLWLPDVWPLTRLADVVSRIPAAALAEPGGPMFGLEISANPHTILIGPEGGFSPAEFEDQPLVGLPGNILRTESAAICAGVLLVMTAQRG